MFFGQRIVEGSGVAVAEQWLSSEVETKPRNMMINGNILQKQSLKNSIYAG
jgi:hypothetical protein